MPSVNCLMSDTDNNNNKKNLMKYFMTTIVITVIKVNYEGIMEADNWSGLEKLGKAALGEQQEWELTRFGAERVEMMHGEQKRIFQAQESLSR